MVITVIMVGKTSEAFVAEGVDLFVKRLKHYLPVNQVVIPDIRDRKNLSPNVIREKEAEAILAVLPKSSTFVLLDERGTEFRSVDFAGFLQKQMNSGNKELLFVIGGAYGVSQTLRKRADFVLSLSLMTFTHQFIRLMLAEQLYRAMTILKNEPYHNE